MVDFSSLYGRGISSAPFVFGTVGITISKQISAGIDDCEETKSTGAISRLSADLDLCSDGGTFVIVGLRFLAVGIPQGRTIQSAYVQFVANAASPNDTPTITIAGQATDSAASISTTAFDLSSRTKTTATVAWSPAQWVNIGDAGTAQKTPDISPIIQEIVNRPGFTASSNILLLFYDPTDNTATRSAFAQNANSVNAPTLVVTYL
jgi:hypothetical protein